MTKNYSNSLTLSPACLFSIFDQFQRRSELCTGRLIGAIYGTRQYTEDEGAEGEKISILQAFPIPHSELNGQVNINNEYYKSRAELLRTCYGRSQYILGWYSIRMSEASVQSACTAFIHDVFCKEINKSSPVTAANAAIHLEIVIDAQTGSVSMQVMIGSGAEKVISSACPVSYAPEDAALLARNDSVQWNELISKAPAELMAMLPDAEAYEKQAGRFKGDLKGFNELMGLLVDELHASQRLYMN